MRVVLTKFVGRLNVKYGKKKEAKDDLKILTQAIKKMELPLTELGKPAGRAGWGGVNSSSIWGICEIFDVY